MRLSYLAVIAALTLLAVLGCFREPSDAVNQDKIYTDYELFYNANEDKTYARATFKFSNLTGTKLELSDPSEVTFEGDLLSFKPALAYYEKTLPGLVSSGTYEWKDIDGNTFTNSISINDIAFPAGLDTLMRDASFTLTWVGSPLDVNENVTLTANGENEGDAQIFFTSDQAAQFIVLGKDKLEKIGQGPGMLFLDRRFQPGLTEATSAGGLITGRYRPENAAVRFE